MKRVQKKIARSLLAAVAVSIVVGAGALSAGTHSEPKKMNTQLEAAFGVPIANGFYGSYEASSGFRQIRVCRSYGRILTRLQEKGYDDFTSVRIDHRYIQMNASKAGQSYRLRVNRCTGQLARRWES